MNTASRFITARRNASQEAIGAESYIEQMPETHANQYVVLTALIQHFNAAFGCDYSLVLSHLEEAMEALDEVRAHSDEEIASWVKEHMDDQRRAA